MKLTEQQIEKSEEFKRFHSKRKNIVVIQYRWDTAIKKTGIFDFMVKWNNHWSNYKKFNNIKDAIKSLESIGKKNNVLKFQYRVFVEEKQIGEGFYKPDELLSILSNLNCKEI